MAKLILIFSFFISLSVSAKNITVISDLDDTLKITNVGNWAEAVANALFSTKAFRGMPTLLKEMEAYSNDLYILSASPKILTERIDDFLDVNQIETRDVFLRALLGGDLDKEVFKHERIQYVLDNSQGDQIILIGDNTQLDPTIYAQKLKENPSRITAAYIHKVKNIPAKNGIIDYYTAYDVALNEYTAGRMSALDASNIARELLMTKDMSLYFPDFAHCPKKIEEFQVVESNLLTVLTTQVRQKIIKYCSGRDRSFF